MSMRSFPDRVRHTVMFEIIGLALVIPGGAMLFNLPATHMGVIGVGSATVATLWNFVYNLGFDHAMLRFTGHTRKSLRLRVLHALLFEGGLILLAVPLIAALMKISLLEAFILDIGVLLFFLPYTYVYHWGYDVLREKIADKTPVPL